MGILVMLGYAYLGVGVLYAIYILLFAWDPWYVFPINAVGGPVVLSYLLYVTFTNRRFPWGE